jgi:hypothetical protein
MQAAIGSGTRRARVVTERTPPGPMFYIEAGSGIAKATWMPVRCRKQQSSS